MSEVQTAGVVFGIIVTVFGLVSAIYSVINYGLDDMSTVIFVVIFLVGLLITGVVESQ